MRRLLEELKVVPRAVLVLAPTLYIAAAALIWLVMFPHDEDTQVWPLAGRVLFAAGMPLFFAIWVLIVGYVYGDARRRGMRYGLWTLLAIFIPNAIGVILYFVLRDPLLRACPQCGTSVSSSFPYCPACGSALARTCSQCKRPVEPGWSHCAHCGADLRSGKLPVSA